MFFFFKPALVPLTRCARPPLDYRAKAGRLHPSSHGETRPCGLPYGKTNHRTQHEEEGHAWQHRSALVGHGDPRLPRCLSKRNSPAQSAPHLEAGWKFQPCSPARKCVKSSQRFPGSRKHWRGGLTPRTLRVLEKSRCHGESTVLSPALSLPPRKLKRPGANDRACVSQGPTSSCVRVKC